jgi:hypothetical protein
MSPNAVRAPVTHGPDLAIRGLAPITHGLVPLIRGLAPVTHGLDPVTHWQHPVIHGLDPVIHGLDPWIRDFAAPCGPTRGWPAETSPPPGHWPDRGASHGGTGRAAA